MAPPAGGAEDRQARGVRAGESLAGRYRLSRPIAAGPATEVWTARDEVLDRTVLVKLLRVGDGDSKTRERFRREAVGVARLSHPGIVAVYDTILDSGVTGLVLEHVQATPLSRFLHEGGSVSPEEAVSIALQVADALEAAHNNDVRHGNLSSDSVWLCSDQRVKITDFGTAWRRGPAGAEDRTETPAAGRQADIRALGCLVQDSLAASTPPVAVPDGLADFVAEAQASEGGLGFTSVAEARAHLVEAQALHGEPDAGWEIPGSIPPGPLADGHDTSRDRARLPGRRLRAPLLVAAAAVAAITTSVLSLTGGDESPPGQIPQDAQPVAPPPSVEVPDGAGANRPTPVPDGADTDSGSGAAPGGDADRDAPDAGAEAAAEPAGGGPGVAVVEVQVVTFRSKVDPEGDPDALRTLDGDEATHWATPGLGAGDATVGGVGLQFQLAEPTEVAHLAVTSDTTGWVAAVYLGTGDHDRLSDWGPLFDQQTNTTGRMILDLAGQEAAAVLLWIPDPRAAVTDEIRIAEVVISAPTGAELR